METFKKRQKETRRLERQRDKEARRLQRKQDRAAGITPPDDDNLTQPPDEQPDVAPGAAARTTEP